jgi:hypothetical protein
MSSSPWTDKTQNTVLRDRSFIDEMKADILRRAEAMSSEENENSIGVDFAYDEELEASGLGGVKVAGVGDDESGWEDDRDGGDEDGPPQRPNPETGEIQNCLRGCTRKTAYGSEVTNRFVHLH